MSPADEINGCDGLKLTDIWESFVHRTLSGCTAADELWFYTQLIWFSSQAAVFNLSGSLCHEEIL